MIVSTIELMWLVEDIQNTLGDEEHKNNSVRRIQSLIKHALEEAAELALAIDNGRGNEKEIAHAIRSLEPQERKVWRCNI